MRRVPHSGRWPQFRQRALEASLADAGVRYTWEGEALGGLRDAADAAASARHGAISQPMFAAYAAHMESDAFRAGAQVEVVRVPEDHLRAGGVEVARGQRFHGRLGADRHELGRVNRAVRCDNAPQPCAPDRGGLESRCERSPR